MHIPNRYGMSYQTLQRPIPARRRAKTVVPYHDNCRAGFRVGLRLVTKAEPPQLAASFTSVGLFHWSATGLPR